MPKNFSKKHLREINRKKKIKRQKTALQYMYRLAELCQNPAFTPWRRRYSYLIKTIGMKAQQPIPKDLKYLFCRSCYTWYTLTPKPTIRIRIRAKPIPHIVYTCLHCGTIHRKPYQREKSKANT